MTDICMKVAVTGYGNLPKKKSVLGSSPVKELTYLYIPAVSEFGKNSVQCLSSSLRVTCKSVLGKGVRTD